MIRRILSNMFSGKDAVDLAEIMGSVPEGALRFAPGPVRHGSAFSRSLRIRQVDAGSCNACEWECTALTNPFYDIQRFGLDFVASPRHADILLVSGPVTRQMELALRKTWLATPGPKAVVACGDCALDGGIFRGSYAVRGGVAGVLPVDLHVLGCPPAPSVIAAGLISLAKRAAGKGSTG